jgi:ABC-2 type transport system permease protein
MTGGLWATSRSIARIELVRKWRALLSSTGQLIAMGVLALFVLLFSVIALSAVFVLGQVVGDGTIDTPLELVRAFVVTLWVGVVAFSGYRVFTTALQVERVDGLLTTTSHRNLIGGLVLAELALWGVPTVLVGGLFVTVFAAGAGTPAMIPFTLLAVCTTVLTGVVSGFLIALLVKNAGVRSKLLARLRTLAFVLLGIAYFWFFISQAFTTVFDPLVRLLGPTPVGWYADLALIGSGLGSSPFLTGGALVATAGFLVVSALLLARLSELLWYADGIHIETRHSETPDESRFSGIVPEPLLGVLIADLKRARRAPITLSFAIYPLIVLINPLVTLFETGTVGASFPLYILLCGAWITGSLFTLNVIGNEGAVLPVTVLSDAPERALVGGHTLAGVVIGLPLTVGPVAILTILSPHDIGAVLTITASAAVLALAAPPLATGIGATLPRYDAVSVSRSTKAIIPSTLAFVVYSLSLLVIALPTLLVHTQLFGGWLASAFSTDFVVVHAIGTGFTAVLAVGVALASGWIAVRTVRGYSIE